MHAKSRSSFRILAIALGLTFLLGCDGARGTATDSSSGNGRVAPGRWYLTCGDPVLCTGWRQKPNVSPCTTQKAGETCTALGDTCDPKDECNKLLLCATSDPTLQDSRNLCPISRARYKTDIRYLDRADLDRLRSELLRIRLATYRYRAAPGAPAQLGFILDDVGAVPWVNTGGDTVNLYGYTSMAVAAVQAQERELAVLREEVASLRKQVGARTAHCREPERSRDQARAGDPVGGCRARAALISSSPNTAR